MYKRWKTCILLPTETALLILTGCGSSSSTSSTGPPPPSANYTLGGTVSGLSGSGLVLQDNLADNLAVHSNGSFTFSTAFTATGTNYLVTVLTQPSNPTQSCIVRNAVGSALANVTNVQVTCSTVPDFPASILTAANEWTWAGGSSIANQAGVYGTQGISAPSNTPGARSGAVGWTDASGNLWLFGGAGPTVGGGCAITHALCWAGTNEYFNDLWKFDGEEWTWVSGSKSTDQPGVYGTMRQAGSGNVPGARYGAVSWTDGQGNLWLFGGTGYDSAGNVGPLNDLWEYSNGEWIWTGGSKLIDQPGTYGTQGKPAVANFPGARSGAVGFADSAGNFWLFGGQGCDSTSDCGGALNDLWEYSGGQWTWVKGANVSYPAQPGIYGTEGTPAPGNLPGARYSATGWIDPSDTLWVFGGVGYNTLYNNVAWLNDLMKFSGSQWTWMSGYDNLIDQYGTYGVEGTPAPGNVPGSRNSAASWTDASGNLWLFGGSGFGAASSSAGSYLNDLWKFSAGQWIWESGSSIAGQPGIYGTLGVPSANTIAGARYGAVTWTDANGNLWLFGGTGLDSTTVGGDGGDLNDLWVFHP